MVAPLLLGKWLAGSGATWLAEDVTTWLSEVTAFVGITRCVAWLSGSVLT